MNVLDVGAILSHPLLLLVLGSVITSILISRVSRHWQNHEKELEVKIALTSKISDSVTRIVMAVQFAEVRAVSQTQADYDKAYLEWEVKRGEISSEIRSYFPDLSIADAWDQYSGVVTDFYVLSGSPDTYRSICVQKASTYFKKDDFRALESASRNSDYLQAFMNLQNHILSRKNFLDHQILASKSALR